MYLNLFLNMSQTLPASFAKGPYLFERKKQIWKKNYKTKLLFGHISVISEPISKIKKNIHNLPAY